MAPLQCLVNETLVVLETNKVPITHLVSQLKTNNLKVTRNLREKSSGLLAAGGGGGGGLNIFTKRLFATTANQLKILYLLHFYD